MQERSPDGDLGRFSIPLHAGKYPAAEKDDRRRHETPLI
jgi:hypothetical protein